MKKLILISALLLTFNIYAHDHSPGAKHGFDGNYPSNRIYFQYQRVSPPSIVDIVCIYEDSLEEPNEIHISFDREVDDLIWMKGIAEDFWVPYDAKGTTSGDIKSDDGDGGLPDKWWVDYLYRQSAGVIKLSSYSYDIRYATELEAFRSEIYSISIYTSKISYSMHWEINDRLVTHKSIGDCNFITLPKSLKQEKNVQPKNRT